MDYYKRFKSLFCYEEYIDKIENDALRKQFSCLRLTSHCLEIEFGRFNGVDRQNRLCKLCQQNVIESEYHFIICCPRYSEIRRKYLGHISWPNVNKFINFMSTKSKKTLINLAKFIKEAFKIRKNTLAIITVS